MLRRFTTALLDIDGTLLLSNDAHARAWRDAFAEFDIAISLESARRLIGMGSDKLLETVRAGFSPERYPGSAIAARHTELFLKRELPNLRPAPGARELLLKLRQRGMMLIVATSAKSEELSALLHAARIDDLIDISTTSDEAERSKPDPHIVQAALRKGNVGAHEAILLGDTPYDLEAATKAGVAMVAVRCGGWTDLALKGAIAIYDDPGHIVGEFSLSPFTTRD